MAHILHIANSSSCCNINERSFSYCHNNRQTISPQILNDHKVDKNVPKSSED